MTQYRFNEAFEPPAPVLPVHVSGVAAHTPAVLLPMLVDTGADCSLIPVRLARTLRLPVVDELNIVGVGNRAQRVSVHAARLRVGRMRLLARVAALGDEALLGRELLNLIVMRLDGPEKMLHLTVAAKPKRK
jgi:predicted aspartyl protease